MIEEGVFTTFRAQRQAGQHTNDTKAGGSRDRVLVNGKFVRGSADDPKGMSGYRFGGRLRFGGSSYGAFSFSSCVSWFFRSGQEGRS